MRMPCLLFLFSMALSSSASVLNKDPLSPMGPVPSDLTDKNQYNAADHAGSPLGWLEKDSSRFRTDLFFRYFKLKDELGNSSIAKSLVMPHIRVGKPGIILFDLAYSPDILQKKSDYATQKLPLHRFEFGLAAGTASGIFQIGLQADLFTGKESHDLDENQRYIIGSDEVSLHLGSRVHELVGIGLSGGIKGYFDSLICQDPDIQDRYFYGTFPLFGGFIDFGKDQFPLRSNFSLGIGLPKFVYVSKPSDKPFGNQDVIRADSVGWDWKTMIEIPAAGNFSVNPAFKIGYRRMTSRIYLPTEDNNPWEHDAELSDSNWTVSSFGMGFGVSSGFLKYVDMNLEYSFKNLSFENGAAFSEFPDQKYWYHHIAFGVQGNLQEISFLRIPESMEIIINADYFNFRQSQIFDPWRLDLFEHVNVISNQSQSYRYTPGLLINAYRFAGFNLGIGSKFLNGLFGIDTDLVFLRDGLEFGVNVSYNLK